ncbi:Sex peptide receptor [Orchesella cincta]|uniref:Sex peptide receptor n=1 Tax=Orchesella cincta TaxID=48709 RepID=A0A1D2MRS9_ORCCI|nr:Sex peptide receptor [Orchesella cincta]
MVDDSVEYSLQTFSTISTMNDNFVGESSDEIINATQFSYCGAGLKAFGDAYSLFHGYTSLVVCLFGTVANILNVITLTRAQMRNPTNAIFTALAIADLLNMTEYIPYAIYRIYFSHQKTYGWAVYVLIHSHISQVCHTISIWLNVTLAVWRYIMVTCPLRSRALCTMARAKFAIALAYFISPVLCIPIYLNFSVKEIVKNGMDMGNSSGGTGVEYQYVVELSNFALENPALKAVNFWFYSVVIKLIPCAILSVVSIFLILSLIGRNKQKSQFLTNRLGGGQNDGENEICGFDRTTKMLLVVLLLFLFTEFPQGLLGLFSGSKGEGDRYFRACYMPFADLMDFFALLNNAINFILYCTMGHKFRETFSQTFKVQEIKKFWRQRALQNIHPVDETPKKPYVILVPLPNITQFRSVFEGKDPFVIETLI